MIKVLNDYDRYLVFCQECLEDDDGTTVVCDFGTALYFNNIVGNKRCKECFLINISSDIPYYSVYKTKNDFIIEPVKEGCDIVGKYIIVDKNIANEIDNLMDYCVADKDVIIVDYN